MKYMSIIRKDVCLSTSLSLWKKMHRRYWKWKFININYMCMLYKFSFHYGETHQTNKYYIIKKLKYKVF